jgi:hypothetical protein
MSKKYTWSFMGQIHAQGDRAKMIERLKSAPGEHYYNINQSWLSKDSVETQDYRSIMADSIFVPCPRGNSSVDSFRLYEVLECGAIPIIEKDESWKKLLGDHPLLETDPEWNKAFDYITELHDKDEFLKKYKQKISNWWSRYKCNLSKNIQETIVDKKYRDKVYYNPSSIRYKDKKYILYRTDKYPVESLMDYQNIHGEYIDFERSLFGYSLKTIHGENETIVDCTFNVSKGTYKETRTIDLPDNQYEKPEDIKFIQNTFEEKNGDLCCLATCNAIVQSKITSGSKLQDGSYDKTKKMNIAVCVAPAFCEINLSKGMINYIDMIGSTKNVTRQKSYEKNWAVFKEGGMYYCIYSIEPLIYKSARSLKDIKFDDDVFGKYIKYHSPCNPYYYKGKYYLIVHERLKEHHYILEKSLVTFELRDGKIEQVEKIDIDFKDEAYCSGLYVDSDNIEIYAGYNDIETKRIEIKNPVTAREADHLKLSNPSALRVGNEYYGVFRGEDFSEQIKDIENHRIGIVQSLIYTKASYWMKVFDLELRTKSTRQMKFVYNDQQYFEYYRKQAENGIAVFEDLRLIEGSDRKNEDGDLCADATCAMLTQGFWEGYPAYSPGLCEVNFSRSTITFKKMLYNVERGDENQKNWMCVKADHGSFTIASVFPLAYQFDGDGKFGIKNKSVLSIANNCEYRNSCQPIKIKENKYGMLCHKKSGTKYNYLWVELLVNDRSIEVADYRSIDMPHENSYCSGIFLDASSSYVLCFAGINNFEYQIYDLEIELPQQNIKDKNIEIKKQELIQLKNQWEHMVDRDYLRYISDNLKKIHVPSEKFSAYNRGNKIAFVSLYTKEIQDYAICSEINVKNYCLENGYTFYVYREKLDDSSSANWSKAQAIFNHFNDHEAIVWIDSDAIILNPDKKIEDILSKCPPQKHIIACEDIGTNNKKLPKGSMFNSGVVIFRNHQYTKNIIQKWMNFEGDKSSLYASGGDQEILCNILKKSDGFGFNRKIFPMNEFNTEPRFIDDDTFIVHFMAYPFELKKIFMNYLVSR